MRVPTIHLNGTGPETLLGEARHALESVQTAAQAIREITVHGRDFYPQGNDAIVDAMAARNSILQRLAMIEGELVAYALAVTDAAA